MSTTRAPAVTGGRFALFADCLLVGVFTAVAAAPLFTAYPALVTACAMVRERLTDDRSVGPVVFARQFAAVLRSGPSSVVVPGLLVTVLTLDAIAVASGVPGGAALGVMLALCASAGAVLGLRAAARWRPGRRWSAVVRSAAQSLVRDPRGNGLLWAAAASAVAIAVAVPITVLLVAGPLALAAVAVDAKD